MRLLAFSWLMVSQAWALSEVLTPFGSNPRAPAIRHNSNNKIIVGGGGDGKLGVLRYTYDGMLDTTFNGTGMVKHNFSSYDDYANAVALEGSKIVAAGVTGFTIPQFNCTQAIMARYNSNGSLDTTFNGTGTLTANFGTCVEGFNEVRIDGSGRIVAGGFILNASGVALHPMIARFNSDGTLDTTFGSGGWVQITAVPDWTASQTYPGPQLRGIAFDSGKLVISGDDKEWWTMRLNDDGSVDTSFGTNGLVIDFPSSLEETVPYDVHVQSNGQIVVAGAIKNSATCMGVMRHNNDGALDTSFGSGGLADICLTNLQGGSFDIDSMGRYFVSGTYNFGASYAVARFTAAGALDTSFNTVGYRLVSFPGYTVYYRYVGTDVDANDNVMLSGIIADSAGNHYIGLTRILPNGLPDGTF